jgi:L-lysine 2,3-aminomutase
MAAQLDYKITEAPTLKTYGSAQLDLIPGLRSLPDSQIEAMKAVATVLPFRVSNYVTEQLIDWGNIPDDPIFQLTFPQKGMLDESDFEHVLALVRKGASNEEVRLAARAIQYRLNPHPAGQMELNVPLLGGQKMEGIQHKYKETVLFFPAAGQTCFAYCTYCFRWPQFVGIDELKFADNDAGRLVAYLKKHREVQSVLVTGGDPLIMRAGLLRRYIEPLVTPELAHVTSIRIGTKAFAYWPYRFISDADADDLLRLFSQVVDSGRHLALMAHYSHPRELETEVSKQAVRRVQSAGAVIRAQAPCIQHVNDDPDIWARLWALEVQQGIVPYYMFVERDTGARRYFEVPLARVLDIYQKAYAQVTGLGRTVRGPSMSATPGKILVDGVAEVAGQKVFVLKMIQGRNPAWVNRVFFARYDRAATWLDDLRPAFGEREFFYQPELKRMKDLGNAQVWYEQEEQDSITALYPPGTYLSNSA